MEVTMRAYWAEGSQIHVHTNGDLAMQVRQILKEQAPGNDSYFKSPVPYCSRLSPYLGFIIAHDLFDNNHHDQVVLDIVEKLEGEKPRKSHRTTIEHAGFFTPAQVFSIGS